MHSKAMMAPIPNALECAPDNGAAPPRPRSDEWSAGETTAQVAIERTVSTLAHHINNRLMTFSLELDDLQRADPTNPFVFHQFVDAARRCIRDISAIVRALDRLREAQAVNYVGSTEMIDIEAALTEQLRQLNAEVTAQPGHCEPPEGRRSNPLIAF